KKTGCLNPVHSWFKLFTPLIILLVILASSALPFLAHSQNTGRIVRGIVTNEASLPLSDVTVTLKGTTIATVSDEKGAFIIRVPGDESVLVFTSVGMASRELIVGNNTDISVVLNTESQNLGEVVVVGYGTQKRANLT